MAKEPSQEGGGVLIRGADGALYFIRASDLQSYRVPDEKAAAVRRALGDLSPVVSVEIIGGKAAKDTNLIGSDAVMISVVNVGAIRPPKP
jgi:hypothetical protein